MHPEKDKMETIELDEIFKDNLALIRPHILSIKSIADANLCRMWLERLSTCSTQERVIRNAYTCELRCQVEVGSLKPPFNFPPPKGSLLPFTPDIGNELDDSSWGDISQSTVCQLYSEEESTSSTEDSLSAMSVAQKGHAQCLQMQQQYEERIAADQLLINRYKQALCFFLSNQNPDEELMNKITQDMYEKKVASLKFVIKELKNQNENLQHNAENLQQNVENLQKSRKQEKNDNWDWHSLYEEINTLKAKLADVQNSKKSLEESHKEVIAHYQQEMGDAICHLCQRLNEAQFKTKNVEMKLQVALDQLEKLFVQLSKEKLVPAIEDRKSIEKRNQQQHDINSKVMNLKSLVELKNEEVKHLEAVLKTQCFKMQEEVNFIKDDLKVVSEKTEKKFKAKVTELQKVVDKHSQMKEHLLKKFNHKLSSLQKERHLEVKGLELQLHTQRAEIVASLSQDKQRELEMVVENLEDRYKELLMDVEKRFIKRHEDDQMRISQLEAELSDLLSQNSTAT